MLEIKEEEVCLVRIVTSWFDCCIEYGVLIYGVQIEIGRAHV